MALEAGSYGYEGLMKRRKTNWLMPVLIGGALGAVGFLAYKKASAQNLPEIADPWGPSAAATTNPMQGLGALGCGCGMPIHGYR